ncbi:Hok/Gef family protein [Vibrio harveyi]|uniref:Hok/Gef family protein n=1 Tax=Vibrio harveyi TaxID=669 RepID=UPI0035A35582
MYLNSTNTSLFTTRRQRKMPKSKTALAGLTVICITVLVGLWIVRDSLCEVQYKGGNTNFLARFVVYETVK